MMIIKFLCNSGYLLRLRRSVYAVYAASELQKLSENSDSFCRTVMQVCCDT